MKRLIWGVLTLCLGFTMALTPVRAAPMEGTGGISILKTSVAGDPLPGAAYRILRQATRRELQDSGVKKELLYVDGEHLTVVEQSFWKDADCAGEPVSELVTDDRGMARAYGLPEGMSYLVETRPPEGYERMAAPVVLRIHRYSHAIPADGIRDDAGKLIDNTVHIITIRYRLPDTGAARWQLTVSGIGVVASGAALLWLNRLRKA